MTDERPTCWMCAEGAMKDGAELERLRALVAEMRDALTLFKLVDNPDCTWLLFRARLDDGLGAGSIRLDGVYATDSRKRFAIMRAAVARADEALGKEPVT